MTPQRSVREDWGPALGMLPASPEDASSGDAGVTEHSSPEESPMWVGLGSSSSEVCRQLHE